MKKLVLALFVMLACMTNLNSQVICGGVAIHYAPAPVYIERTVPVIVQEPQQVVVVRSRPQLVVEEEPQVVVRKRRVIYEDGPVENTIIREKNTIYEKENTIYREKTNVVTNYQCWKMTIHFLCKSSVLDEDDNVNIYNVYKFLIEHPTVSIRMRAFADMNTGSYAENYDLSKKRAEVVSSKLEDMGIKRSRMIIRYEGCSYQPYTKNNWNRCVLIEVL